jgi:hypothetical protein
MGAWMVKPECGVPLRHYVNFDGGPKLARSCAVLHSASVWGFAVALSAGLVAMYVFLRREDPKTKERKPVLPLLIAAVPLVLGGLYAQLSVPMATKRYRVQEVAFHSSEMSKGEFLANVSGDARTAATVRGSLTSSALVSSAALWNGARARAA